MNYREQYSLLLPDCLHLMGNSCKKEILSFFYKYSNFEGGTFKLAFIASKINYSPRTVERVLRELREIGILAYRSSTKGWCLDISYFEKELPEYEPKKNNHYDLHIKLKQEEYKEFKIHTIDYTQCNVL